MDEQARHDALAERVAKQIMRMILANPSAVLMRVLDLKDGEK